jgi:hypothetical protein
MQESIPGVDIRTDGPAHTRPEEIAENEFKGFGDSIVATNGGVIMGG